MGGIYLPRTWDRQPDGLPIAVARRRLMHLSSWHVSGYDAALVAPVPHVITNGENALSPTPDGLAISSTGANSYDRSAIFDNGDFLAVFAGVFSASNTLNSVVYQKGSAGEIMVGIGFTEGFTSASGRASLTMLQTAVNRSHAYVAGAADGTYHAFAVVKRGTYVQWYLDGAPATTVTSGGFTGSPTTTTDTARLVGNSSNGAHSCTGQLTMSGVLRGTYSDAECRALSANPWQMFRRAPMSVSVSGGAATTPTLSNVTASNLTATGARVSVDLAF